jgi:CRP-like cAMP-binding protein
MASDPVVVRASRKVVQRQFHAAETKIFVEGDPADHAFFVQTGAVLLSKQTYAGIVPHSTVRPKQLFGEMALLGGNRRDFTATAIVDTTCIVILRREFERKFEQTDPMVRTIMRLLAHSLEQLQIVPTWEGFAQREKFDKETDLLKRPPR